MSHPANETSWFKSSFSGGGNDQCVECRIVAGSGVLVRDSKCPSVAPIRFTSTEWLAFLHGVKAREFDRSA
jgi:hypothetical protein